MDIESTKLNVMQKIMQISKPALLEKIDKLLEEELVVGYTVEGSPLTKSAYESRISVAEEQFNSGQYMSQEDLEKESDNW